MRVAVSYISSNYSLKETIKRINNSNSDYIHMDIMDGKYVNNKNFKRSTIKKILKIASKDLDIHLMVKKPSKYLKYFKNNSYVKNLFFHPSSEENPHEFILRLKSFNVSPGIVINPNEKILDFEDYYQDIDRVLVMSVTPGAGGQKFIMDTVDKIKELIDYRIKNKHHFEIAVDGGINDKTIDYLKELDIDYIISGSYICKSDDYNKQIEKLK